MMKGFFRGLRCLFDTDNEKEHEIQIEAPTNVKHVAHIGCDGPSTQAPSWVSTVNLGSGGAATDSPSRTHKMKQTKRSAHGNEPSNHKPRKNKSNSSESSVHESSRTRSLKNSLLGSEPPAQETNVKKTRKKHGEGTTRSSRTKKQRPINHRCSMVRLQLQ
ncbi:hypothetical protein E3N88_01144 [Mikania micrantha]|uniref:CRIB domain-containing protein n=1 Tax=Mikania micrantha TaxID=192012 RepID=A0A5N6Q2G3_9ASTR|nr:hypothetical protein E3N88_01144 [Mikania micrantha]